MSVRAVVVSHTDQLLAGGLGVLYVVEYGNNRVQKFSPRGEPLGCWGGPGRAPGQLHSPWALAVDSKGCVHVLDSENHRVLLFTSSATTNSTAEAVIGQANYTAAKAGIVGLSLTCSLELARLGVTVNCIAPGGKTRITQTMPGARPMTCAASSSKT